MKLRLKGNSIRIRLDRRDLDVLARTGRVEDVLRFGPGAEFSYAVEAAPAPRERPTASYAAGRLAVRIDPEDVRAWADDARVGFENEHAVEDGVVRILLEKDFACLERPAGQESDDAFAFPNPSKSC